jgi:hypothetical protein
MGILLNAYHTRYGNELDRAYARIRFVVINYETKQIQVELAIYASKEAAESGAQPIDYSVNIALPNNGRAHTAFEDALLQPDNIIKLAYQFAKDADERLRGGEDDVVHDYAERVEKQREERSVEQQPPSELPTPTPQLPPPPDSTPSKDDV